MKWVLPTAFLQQLPLLAIFIIPLVQAIFGWRKIRLKSAVHFQQVGRVPTISPPLPGYPQLESVEGGCCDEYAHPATILSLVRRGPLPLILLPFRCLLMRGPSALFFLLGSSFAVPLSIISVAPILHYVPSPSVIAYLQHRFSSTNCEFPLFLFKQNNSVRYWISFIHVCLGFCVSFLLLYQTATLLVSVTAYPFSAVIALLSTVTFVSVALSGHSYVMTPPLLLNLIVSLW